MHKKPFVINDSSIFYPLKPAGINSLMISWSGLYGLDKIKIPHYVSTCSGIVKCLIIWGNCKELSVKIRY